MAYLGITREVNISGIKVGGTNPLAFIAGPCVIENEDMTLFIASRLRNISDELSIPIIFKSSYDKANRTSLNSYRGPGIDEGLRILERVKRETGLPVLSDVHTIEEVQKAREVLDVIQIPAFLCRQTDFVIAVARANMPVNIKKGQFLAPWDMKHILEKVTSAGNEKILLCERGTSFGYNNLVVDMRSLVILREMGYPVVFDATHSVQLPGGRGSSSGGQREFVPALARAAVAAGVDVLFMEVHPDPDQALCDGPNSIPLKDTGDMLKEIIDIDKMVKRRKDST